MISKGRKHIISLLTQDKLNQQSWRYKVLKGVAPIVNSYNETIFISILLCTTAFTCSYFSYDWYVWAIGSVVFLIVNLGYGFLSVYVRELHNITFEYLIERRDNNTFLITGKSEMFTYSHNITNHAWTAAKEEDLIPLCDKLNIKYKDLTEHPSAYKEVHYNSEVVLVDKKSLQQNPNSALILSSFHGYPDRALGTVEFDNEGNIIESTFKDSKATIDELIDLMDSIK